jgi:hypothetical protein
MFLQASERAICDKQLHQQQYQVLRKNCRQMGHSSLLPTQIKFLALPASASWLALPLPDFHSTQQQQNGNKFLDEWKNFSLST